MDDKQGKESERPMLSPPPGGSPCIFEHGKIIDLTAADGCCKWDRIYEVIPANQCRDLEILGRTPHPLLP